MLMTSNAGPGPALTGVAQRSPQPRSATALHEHARERMVTIERGGVFRSDWLRAVFIHYEVQPQDLAPVVPLPLDLWGGHAIVSVVAFLMRRFRPRRSGPPGALIMAPCARHALLNLRTYVRPSGEPGIVFLAEWVPNPLSAWLGPHLFGLPYRLGRMRYRHEHQTGKLTGRICTLGGGKRFEYRASVNRHGQFGPAGRGTIDEFLLERYTAYTIRRGFPCLFRIWQEPWRCSSIVPEIAADGLLRTSHSWFARARLVGGHYSPGVKDVWIGMPRRCQPAALVRSSS